jgi:hypothetical protein
MCNAHLLPRDNAGGFTDDLSKLLLVFVVPILGIYVVINAQLSRFMPQFAFHSCVFRLLLSVSFTHFKNWNIADTVLSFFLFSWGLLEEEKNNIIGCFTGLQRWMYYIVLRPFFFYFTIPSFHDSTSRHLSKIMRLKQKGKQYRKHWIKKTTLFPGFKKSFKKICETIFRTKK